MIQAKLLKAYSADNFFGLLAEIANPAQSNDFFCTIPWLTSWFKSMDTLPPLVVFSSNSQVVGLVFLGFMESKMSLFSWNKGLVNQTGIQTYDQVWIEYNRIYCDPAIEQECICSLLNLASTFDIDELVVSMSKHSSLWIRAATKFWRIESDTHFGAKVDLLSTNETIKFLSKNTRYQVKRAIKAVEIKYGKLSVSKANTSSDKEKFFSERSAMHKKKWASSEFGSGFQNPSFNSHLLNLLNEFSHNAELVAVFSGETLVGISLNLIADDKVGFYCSGINYEIADKKIKPGYILHSLMIEYYRDAGKKEYDFLAGYSQYKSSLATDIYSIETLRLTKRNLRGTIIHLLRSLKHLFLKIKQKTKT